MGMHYVECRASWRRILDPTRPQIVIYEPLPDGTLKLIGADSLCANVWHANHAEAPEMMGQLFHLFEAPNRFGLPAFYTLHVWAWKDNTQRSVRELAPASDLRFVLPDKPLILSRRSRRRCGSLASSPKKMPAVGETTAGASGWRVANPISKWPQGHTPGYDWFDHSNMTRDQQERAKQIFADAIEHDPSGRRRVCQKRLPGRRRSPRRSPAPAHRGRNASPVRLRTWKCNRC